VDTLGQIARREVDLGTREDFERKIFGRQAFVQFPHERRHARGDVLVDAVDQVRSRNRGAHAVLGDGSAERDRVFPSARAVVDARQKVAVNVDHACGLLCWRSRCRR
jgi:hypothetical protein